VFAEKLTLLYVLDFTHLQTRRAPIHVTMYMGSWAHESFFRASRRLAVWRRAELQHIICSLLQTGHSWGRRLSSASSFYLSVYNMKSSRAFVSLVLYPCPAWDKPSISHLSFLIHAGQLDFEMTTRDYFYWFYFLRTAASKLSSRTGWVELAASTSDRLICFARVACFAKLCMQVREWMAGVHLHESLQRR